MTRQTYSAECAFQATPSSLQRLSSQFTRGIETITVYSIYFVTHHHTASLEEHPTASLGMSLAHNRTPMEETSSHDRDTDSGIIRAARGECVCVKGGGDGGGSGGGGGGGE